MSGLEPYSEWTLVGRSLAVALLVAGAAAVALAVITVRRVPPAHQGRVINVLLGVALGLPLAGLALWVWSPATFFLLTCKEGIFEFATLPVLLMATAVFLDGARTGRIRIWGYPWALACAVVLAEEIDYGQLLFGFRTPGWVLPHTGQSDLLNFHNTPTVTVGLFAGAVVVFGGLPLAARLGSTAPLLRRLKLRPPPRNVIAAVWLTTLVINGLAMGLGIDANLQEVTELSLAMMLWAYGLHWWWAADRERGLSAPEVAPASSATR